MGFICTDPERAPYDKYRGKYHPKEWELRVQSDLRGLDVPVSAGEALLLGYDSDGLAAASHFGFDETQTIFMIWAVACAQRVKGHGVGKEALERTLQALSDTNIEYGIDHPVLTRVDPRNVESRTMIQGAGFTYLQTQKNGLERWVLWLRSAGEGARLDR